MGRVFFIILFLFVSSLSTHSVGKELGINHSKNKDLAALGDTSSKTYRRDTSYIKSRKEVLRIIENEIGDENTCLDEYLLREKHLRRWLIWTPPLGILLTPPLTVAGFYAGGYTGILLGAKGWNALGGFLLGEVITFGAGVLTTLGVTTVSAVKFYKNRQLFRLIVDSHQIEKEYPYKTLKKFHKLYRRKYSGDDSVDLETFKQAIRDFDTEGSLCDGTMRSTYMGVKLKKRLARKKDLFAHIHRLYGHLRYE